MPTPLDPIPADAAPEPFAEAVARAESGGERVILTRGGRPVAAVVPIADLEAIEDAEDAAEAQRLIVEWETAGRPIGASLEELAERYGITLDPDAE